MPKKFTYNPKQANKHLNLISLIAVLFLALGLILGYVLSQPKAEPTVPDSVSEKNLNVWADALTKKDASLCDDIQGGINANQGRGVNLKGGVGIADSFGNAAYDEDQARSKCRQEVNELLSR
jgi:hypothetical protein